MCHCSYVLGMLKCRRSVCADVSEMSAFLNDGKHYSMLYLNAHASAHFPIDAALEDMVIELLLDMAATHRSVLFVVAKNTYLSISFIKGISCIPTCVGSMNDLRTSVV